MEIREIRSLVAVAESGSLARTSRTLHLTSPAIHKQLKNLEAELGVQLYERAGRRLRSTLAARTILPYLKELLANYDSARRVLEELRGMRKGIIRIGAGASMSTVVMPPLLSLFRQRHPNIDIELVTGTTLDLHARLIDGELDCCLLVASESAEDPLVVEHSWQVELVLASRLPQTPKRCSLARLKTCPFLMLRKGSRLQDLIDRYLAGYRFQPRVVVRSDSVEALLAMVKTGNGIAMLPAWLVEGPLRRGELSAIRQNEPPLVFAIDLVRRRTGYVPPALQAFIEMVRSEAHLPPPGRARRTFDVSQQ